MNSPIIPLHMNRPAKIFRALVFDFDGLICDTESPQFDAWREIFRSHGSDLTLEWWSGLIGRANHGFDPHTHLEQSIGRPLDRDAVYAKQREHFFAGAGAMPSLPGVVAYLDNAMRLGLKLAVASSSSRQWVAGHLERLGLLERFTALICREDTLEHKPHPAPYLAAARALNVEPGETVALEDSPHGIAAAKAAGMRVVTVPNRLTALLDTSAADIRLASMAEIPLESLLRKLSI